MPELTGGELIVEAFRAEGIRHIFGVPGESFLGLLDALVDSPIRFVSTRHEGAASFMASGYSRQSGEIGVCVGTRAVGAANLTIGVHNAFQDSTPMVAIAGQVNRSFAGREAFQEVDLVAAMRPYTKWAGELSNAALVPEMLARAIAIATSGRPGPVFLSLPQEVANEKTSAEPRRPASVFAPAPDGGAVRAAIDLMLGAERAVIFSGGGCASPHARRLLVEFAEAAELPVITDWRHHDGFPNDHRLFLGSASLGATPAVFERLGAADVVLVLGNRMQENATAGYLLPSSSARIIQVDVDPSVMTNHRSAEIGIQADAALALESFIAALDGGRGHERRRPQNQADRSRFVEASTLPEPPEPVEGRLGYVEVVATIARVLPTDAVLTSDAGNFYGWLSRYHRFVGEQRYIGPASGAMGYGLPAAIGAKLAAPGRPVVSFSGDGGFFMTMAELDTASRYQAPVVAVVFDNARHGTIRMHQERQHPDRVLGTELEPRDLSLVAAGLGANGVRVAEAGEFEAALREALGDDTRPSVIQLAMDRDQLSVETRLAS